MTADDDYQRTVVFTSAARDDLRWLKERGFSVDDWQRLKCNLTRVAKLPDVLDDKYVCELRMCRKGEPVWYRLKQAHLRPSLRVAFEADDRTLTVWAVVQRTDSTYQIIEARLRRVAKGAQR